MSKGIKYISTYFNTPSNHIIKQTKKTTTMQSLELVMKNENSKKKEQHMKKNVNIYNKKWKW